MVWAPETSCGHESAKIAELMVPYLQGKGLDIGCGPSKVWPNAIGVDSCKDYGGNRPPGVDMKQEADDLSCFADTTMDYVFSSHLLEHIQDYKATLKEWWRVIKPGGYLALYLPHKAFYPNMGQPGSNPDHKHDFMPDDIIEAMKEIGSWEMLENEERNGTNEYSFLQVYHKKQGKGSHKFKIWERYPQGKKRCLLIRYGAIGDAIIMSSILPELKKLGYHITVNCTPDTKQVLEHDPNIDDWYLQEKDYVPNPMLGAYWQQIAQNGRWDKIINLCESIEGGLLTLPGRLQHDYPEETRRKLFGTVNYLERTHDIAGVPHVFHQRFYPTPEETAWAKRTIKKCGEVPVVAWPLNGSALHKIYPWTQIVIAWLLQKTPCHVFMLGDKGQSMVIQEAVTAELKRNNIDADRLHSACGWELRKTLAFVQNAHCVIGPETGAMNAAAFCNNAKVIYLSHSSKANLTKHWKNTVALEPDKERCPCFPCLRLHYSWDHCNQNQQTQAAQCASSITPEEIFEAAVAALNLKKMSRADLKTENPQSFIAAHPSSMVAVEATV